MFKLRFRKSPTFRSIEPSLRASFNENEIASMAGLGTLIHVASGDALITEGTAGTHAYFITDGSAAVRRADDVVAMLSPGDLVGESALVTKQPRNATVTAMTPVTALRFSRTEFAWLRLESRKVKALSNDLVASRN